MSGILETHFDKFTFRVPTDRRYTADGVWVCRLDPPESERVRVGVTDFMQQRSGDVAFVTVRPPGTRLSAADDVAEIETIKVNVALRSPVAGTVAEVNPALDSSPELVNQDPYGDGWLAVIAVTNWNADCDGLLTPEAYVAFIRQEAQDAAEPS